MSLAVLLLVRQAFAGGATGSEKEVREAGGEFANVVTSENFAVKWGDAGNFSEAEGSLLLDHLEYAWTVEVEDLGFLPPAVCDRYKFNVYVADTGSPAPASNGEAGYFFLDGENLPAIAIHPAAVAEGYADVTSAHEFFHAIQHGTAQYQVVAEAVWYWEATAMWIEGEVYPEDPDESAYVHAVGLATALPLWDAGDGSFEALADFHQYGAFLFARFLTEWVADRSLIVESWTDSRAAPSPQTTLGFLLEERGVDIASAYADYAARNAVWDYPDGAQYRAVLEAERDRWVTDPDFQEVFATVEGTGLVQADAGPAGGGYQLVRQVAPAPGAWGWAFHGDAGVPWAVRVVRDRAGGPEYYSPELVDGQAFFAFEGDGSDVWLAVSVWTAQAESGTWSLAISGGPEDTGVPLDTGGAEPRGRCQCGIGQRTGASGLALVVMALASARRPR